MITGLHGYNGTGAPNYGAPTKLTDDKVMLMGIIGLGLMAVGYLAMRDDKKGMMRNGVPLLSAKQSRAREADLLRRGYDVARVTTSHGDLVLKGGRALWP